MAIAELAQKLGNLYILPNSDKQKCLSGPKIGVFDKQKCLSLWITCLPRNNFYKTSVFCVCRETIFTKGHLFKNLISLIVKSAISTP